VWEFYVGGYQLLRRWLHDERYRNHWQAKRAWYEKHGFADHLITTSEKGGFDSKTVLEILEERFRI